MENLWPKHLTHSNETNFVKQVIRTLSFQADTLRIVTEGRVEGLLQDRSTNTNLVLSLEIFPANRPDALTPLILIQFEPEKLSLTLESFDEIDTDIEKIKNISDFKLALKDILSSNETKNTIAALSRISNNPKNSYELLSNEKLNSFERPLLIGKITKTSNFRFSHVVLFGIAGFIKEEDIKKLTRSPDTENSSIKKLEKDFVVTTKFIEEVKFTINKKELEKLQFEAEKALRE